MTMWKRYRWPMLLGLTLVILSLGLIILHIALFHNPHDVGFYLLLDVAFLPLEVLLVTAVLHRLLTMREKRSKFARLNMVIGAFYSEAGTRLLAMFSGYDGKVDEIRKNLVLSAEWSDRQFLAVQRELRSYAPALCCTGAELPPLREFLLARREFLLRLLENPSLMEHEQFTDLLWAVFHLTEELAARRDLSRLADADLDHLRGDMRRAYGLLIVQWLDYMQHLKRYYPYLYSLAMRTNPFDPAAQVEVK
jgi:hypothetical protein